LKISNETKVGFLAALSIALFIVGYNFLKGNDVFGNENQFYATYDKVDGLAKSKPVLVNGFPIGRVSDLILQPNGHIIVQFKIDPQYNIPINSTATLESTDLLGSKAIVFKLGNSKQLAQDGDTLIAITQENLLDKVKPVQQKAEVVLARLDSVLASLNKVLNPNFQKNVDKSFSSIAKTLENLEHITKKVDGLVGSEIARIDHILANAEAISANFKSYNTQITGILNNLNSVTDEIAKANFKQTINNANLAMASLQQAMDKVNTGKGSMGLLLNDDKLYSNLKSASKNLDILMIDIKANPKRYVSFSVFGGGGKKKD
jgi:phospholipid/cholesterol/gamma-HCH transport system substrate-binding protein